MNFLIYLKYDCLEPNLAEINKVVIELTVEENFSAKLYKTFAIKKRLTLDI